LLVSYSTVFQRISAQQFVLSLRPQPYEKQKRESFKAKGSACIFRCFVVSASNRILLIIRYIYISAFKKNVNC